jgi:hypothetical protein
MGDSNTGSNKAGDVDSGDLSQWDYLTLNFDHDDIFQERTVVSQPSISNVVHAVAPIKSSIVSSMRFDLEPIPSNHSSVEETAMTPESHLGSNKPYSLSNMNGGKLMRATSCLMEPSLSYWRDGTPYPPVCGIGHIKFLSYADQSP